MSRRSVSWAWAPVFRPDSLWRAAAFDSASRNSGKTRQEDKVGCVVASCFRCARFCR